MDTKSPLVIANARLQEKHRPTGRTKHFHGESELSAPTSLRIVQFSGDNGFYLLYLDEFGEEVTDTYFDELSEVLAQARWEFLLDPDDWVMEVQ